MCMHRWDIKVEDTVYSVNKKRTLKMLQRKELNDSLHEPMLNIELDHVIPDELHLLLRVTDVLINNIITSAISHDISNSTGKPKPLEGPMITQLLKEVRKQIGDQFHVYEKDGKSGWKFSSLSGDNIYYKKLMKCTFKGDDRKKLLKSLPPSFHTCQPPEICSQYKVYGRLAI